MTVRPIVVYDDPLLRQESRRVRRVRPAVRRLIDDMVETMRAADGIGLAAIQVGVPERVVVVEAPEENEKDEGENEKDEGESEGRESWKLYAIVNPKLTRKSREMEDGIEGCLSIPGLVGEVTRHQAVIVEGVDGRGQAVRIRAKGLLARVFQHEIDHCDGVLFIDHIDDPEKIWPVAEGEEEAAEAAQKVPGNL